MKQLIVLILISSFLGCQDSQEQTVELAPVEENVILKSDSSEIAQTDTLSDEELLEMWTWGEHIEQPNKSSIKNFVYSKELLYQQWKFPEGNEPRIEFTAEFFDIKSEKCVYTINYDSLRIFTSADHPGGGIDRGIITYLTEDSLVIHWSTQDTNVYERY